MVAPAADSPFDAETQVVAGNVIGYGATSGEIFLRGKVGERLCVRNSAPSPSPRAWAITAAST